MKSPSADSWRRLWTEQRVDDFLWQSLVRRIKDFAYRKLFSYRVYDKLQDHTLQDQTLSDFLWQILISAVCAYRQIVFLWRIARSMERSFGPIRWADSKIFNSSSIVISTISCLLPPLYQSKIKAKPIMSRAGHSSQLFWKPFGKCWKELDIKCRYEIPV